MNKIYFIICLKLLLTGCINKTHNSQGLIKNINAKLLTTHKLKNGYLVATYDLAKVNQNRCIYAKDYVSIINDERVNQLFIKKFYSKCKDLTILKNEALIKIARIKNLMVKLNNKYKFLMVTELQALTKPPHSHATSLIELAKLDAIIDKIPLLLPAHRPVVTSYYGIRAHPFKKQRRFHCGIDFVDHKATPVYSAANGTVIKVKTIKDYGNTVEIKHAHNFKTKYAHLKSMDVHEGENVLRGQKIGTQGSSGRTTGEHLHFEIWLRNKHVNPLDFIAHSYRY